MGKKSSKLNDFVIETPSQYLDETWLISNQDMDHIRELINYFIISKEQYFIDTKQFTEVILVSKVIKSNDETQLKNINKLIKNLFQLLKFTDLQGAKKVNIFELIILMVIQGKADAILKLKFICLLFDFDKRKQIERDQLTIMITCFISSIVKIFNVQTNIKENTEVVEYMLTQGDQFRTEQKIDQVTIISYLESEDSIINFLVKQDTKIGQNMSKLFAYFNHKKAFLILKKEISENEQYKTMFIHKIDDSKKNEVNKETRKVAKNHSLQDEDKDICSIGIRKVQCGHVKSLYIWFMKNVNEFGTLTNKINQMMLVKLMNLTEAKMLLYFDDMVAALEWFVDKNLEEIGFSDLLIGMWLRKDQKSLATLHKNTVWEWIERFNKNIAMDRSKINQRKTLIELRKLFWMVDKNRSGTIDFDEYYDYVSSVYSLDYAKEKFKMADKDKNADVDFIEFCKMMVTDMDLDEQLAEEIMMTPESKIMKINTNV